MKKYLLVECRKGQIRPISKAVDHLSVVVLTLQEKAANYYGYPRLQDYRDTPEGKSICDDIINNCQYGVDDIFWQIIQIDVAS